MGKSALITGVTGQDGAYLSSLLLDKGYKVYGTYRRLSTPNFWRLQCLDVFGKITLIPADLIDDSSIAEAIRVAEPDELYHLAAQSFVGASFEQPIAAGDVTGLGVVRVLEAVRAINPRIRVYQASTSELYGDGGTMPQSEDTPFHPSSPYAAAKLYGYTVVRIYREAYGLFACNGILFNHESPLRGLEFVTRKITNAVAKIRLGLQNELLLGNLDAKRDWGYAPDYVEAMWAMLQLDHPEDLVIATNESHTVREFVQTAFGLAGLAPDRYVRTDPRFYRPLDVNYLQGDNSKAKKVLNWTPRVTFDELVHIMVVADAERWDRCRRGEQFPWDAPNYPTEANIATRALRV